MSNALLHACYHDLPSDVLCVCVFWWWSCGVRSWHCSCLPWCAHRALHGTAVLVRVHVECCSLPHVAVNV